MTTIAQCFACDVETELDENQLCYVCTKQMDAFEEQVKES